MDASSLCIRDGAMLHVNMRPDAGAESVVSLLAWQPPQHADLRWELRRVLPAVGFDEKGWKQLKTHVATNWKKWTTACELVGLPSTSLGLSLKALRSQGASAEQLSEASQEHVCSTAALLVLCLHWVDFRRQHLHKSMARALLHGFLAGTLPAHSQVAVMVARPPHTCRGSCEVEPSDQGYCACLEGIRDDMLQHSENIPDLPSLVATALLTLGTKWTCKAIRVWIGVIVCAVATDVDSSWHTWGRTSWQKTGEAAVDGKRKQRRISSQLRKFVADQAYSSRASSMNQAENLLERGYTGFASKTVMAEMAGVRTTLHLRAQEIEPVWSLSIDAARLGKPSK
eukprot:5002568-Amphidinium_carterae.1